MPWNLLSEYKGAAHIPIEGAMTTVRLALQRSCRACVGGREGEETDFYPDPPART